LANDLFQSRQMALTLLGPVNNNKEEIEAILFDRAVPKINTPRMKLH
jgi:hypothetical protein